MYLDRQLHCIDLRIETIVFFASGDPCILNKFLAKTRDFYNVLLRLSQSES